MEPDHFRCQRCMIHYTIGTVCMMCSEELRKEKLRAERMEQWPKKRTIRRQRPDGSFVTETVEWCPHDDLEELLPGTAICRKGDYPFTYRIDERARRATLGP